MIVAPLAVLFVDPPGDPESPVACASFADAFDAARGRASADATLAAADPAAVIEFINTPLIFTLPNPVILARSFTDLSQA